MSTATKTGDQGLTSLMFNRRVSKTHPQVEALGGLDELNSAIGLARASSTYPFIRQNLEIIQKDLVGLMGELATLEEDRVKYEQAGFARLTGQQTSQLDALVKTVEDQQGSFRGWATPGQSMAAATLDLARTVCRRTERNVCGLLEKGFSTNPESLVYLNRLGDVLWLMARWSESQTGTGSDQPITNS
jgi:cob(I)alamin adenosyltransferase